MEFSHTSVLLEETIEGLHIRPDGIYVDGTLGGGGHSSRIAEQLTGGRLIGIDQDADAIAAAGERLSPWKDKVTLVRNNYCNMPAVLSQLWAFPPISWTMANGDFPTRMTLLWTCGWIKGRR